MSTAPSTVSDFKAYFDRDFPFGTGFDTVRDNDISKALSEATLVFNPALFNTDEAKVAFLYASAHFLALNIQSAGGLIAVGPGDGVNSQGDGFVSNKSVGSVSATIAFSDRIMQSPILSQFMRTNYGQKYLALVSARLVGAGSVVAGWDDTDATQ
jgi:hypothetical protein